MSCVLAGSRSRQRSLPAGRSALNIYSRIAAAFAAKDHNVASAFAAESSAILAGGRAEVTDGQGARRPGGALRSRQVIARAHGVIRGAFPEGAGLRFAIGGGAALWLAVMWARRSVPESPRIHGREPFGTLITSGPVGPVALAFLIGAAVMALVAVGRFVGARAAAAQPADTARPLTAAVAGGASSTGLQPGAGRPGPGVLAVSADLLLARHHRAQGDEEHARAAGHRTAAHKQLALAAGGNERASRRAGTERLLAEMAEITALAHEERAAACDALADAEAEADRHLAMAARERARAARDRARAHDHDVEALFAWQGADAGRHRALAVAAREWARSHEQRAHAQQLRAAAGSGPGGRPGAGRARADIHDLRAEMHAQRARSHELLAGRDEARAAAAATAADMLAQQARAAEAGIETAEHGAGGERPRASDGRPAIAALAGTVSSIRDSLVANHHEEADDAKHRADMNEPKAVTGLARLAGLARQGACTPLTAARLQEFSEAVVPADLVRG